MISSPSSVLKFLISKVVNWNYIKNLLANVSLFTIQHLQSNLNEFTGYGIYIFATVLKLHT